MTSIKKLTILGLGILLIAVAGYAYAESKDVITSNGITVFEATTHFDVGPVTKSSGMLREDMILANGVSQEGIWYDIGYGGMGSKVDSDAYGSAAGGMSPEGRSLDLHNGITDFTGGPQELDVFSNP